MIPQSQFVKRTAGQKTKPSGAATARYIVSEASNAGTRYMARYSCKNCGALIDGDDAPLIEYYELQKENEALYEQRDRLAEQVEQQDKKLRALACLLDQIWERLR